MISKENYEVMLCEHLWEIKKSWKDIKFDLRSADHSSLLELKANGRVKWQKLNRERSFTTYGG